MHKKTRLIGTLAGITCVLGSATPAWAQTQPGTAPAAPPPTPAAATATPVTPPTVSSTPAPASVPAATTPTAGVAVSADVAPGPVPEVPPAPAPEPAPAPVVVEAAAVIAPEAAPEAKPLAGFDGKAFFVQSDDGANRLEVGARVQPRFTYRVNAGDAKDNAFFSANRAEVRLAGSIFEKELTYKFEADFGRGAVALKDFYVDYAFVPNSFHLRIGQLKKPFSRTAIVSSGNLETTDRAISDGEFGKGTSPVTGRDQGAMIHNNYDKSPTFEWALGIFNGRGEKPWFSGKVTGSADPTTNAVTGEVDAAAGTTIVPSNFHPQVIARLGYNHGEIKGYSEADLEGGPFRLGVGGSGAIDFDADGKDDSFVRGELDAVIKVEGFSLTGSYYVESKQTSAGFDDRGFSKSAYHAQAGYVIGGKVQPLVRFAQVLIDGGKNNEREILGGIGFYPYKHAFKWQTNVGVLTHEATDKSDVLVTSQVQLGF